MYLSGSGVLHVKSSKEWYDLERGGEKPNTVRSVDDADLAMMRQAHTIRVSGPGRRSFERTITGVFDVAPFLGKHLVVICWEA